MAGGQPTKYTKEHCERALEIVGRQGKSIVQLARDFEVSRQTIYQWALDNPEFSYTLEKAKDWAEAMWEDKYTNEFMESKEANAPLVKLYFANRFKWSDKVEKEEDSSAGLTEALSKLIDKLPN